MLLRTTRPPLRPLCYASRHLREAPRQDVAGGIGEDVEIELGNGKILELGGETELRRDAVEQLHVDRLALEAGVKLRLEGGRGAEQRIGKRELLAGAGDAVGI